MRYNALLHFIYLIIRERADAVNGNHIAKFGTECKETAILFSLIFHLFPCISLDFSGNLCYNKLDFAYAVFDGKIMKGISKNGTIRCFV